METKFQTSFIPKTTLVQNTASGGKGSRSFFLMFASIFIIISIVLAGASFAYSKFLEKQKNNVSANLEKNIKAFEPETIRKYAELDSRIDTARALIDKHIALSYFLDFLSSETLKSVSFSDMKYELSQDGKANVSMNGVASGYNAVAFQSALFGKNSNLKDMIFSNLDLDKSGNVVFSLAMKVDPSFIYYKKNAVDFLKKDNASQAEINTSI